MKKIISFLSIFLLLFLFMDAFEKTSLKQAVEDGLKMSGSRKRSRAAGRAVFKG